VFELFIVGVLSVYLGCISSDLREHSNVLCDQALWFISRCFFLCDLQERSVMCGQHGG